jgi:hypothetical protein
MKNLSFLLLVYFILIIFHSCKEDTAEPFILNSASSYKGDVAIDWINLQRNLVQSTGGFSPPVAARSYAYAALALYESVVAGIPQNLSYAGLISEYTGQNIPSLEKGKNYNWELSANACMAYMLRNQFKTSSAANLALIDQLEQTYINSNSTDTATVTRSIAYGRAVAEAVYNYSKTDGKDEAYSSNFPDYVVLDVPGKWEPTSAMNPKPLQPYWGQVRPFVGSDTASALIQTFPPNAYSTEPKSIFYLQANEVYIVGLNLTDEQKKIAKFWSDDPGITATPPGHSMSIAGQVLQLEKSDLAIAAEVFSKVGLAVHDAFISCWKSKYVYNLLRPITYINKNIDASWTTLLTTPSFPEHTSGHSVQTSASMTVLEHYFGSNYGFTDHTHESRTDIDGSPRTFNSFSEITDEAAISRLYGGIHFRLAIESGKDLGKIIGRNIVNISLKK